MTGFRVQTATGVLAGDVVGEGPELLLLHGGPGLSNYLAPLVEELEEAWTVATYTQRGVAPSAVDGDVSVPGHLADLRAVVDHLGWERPLLGGHSWGGHLALHAMARWPQRWRGGLVVDPLGGVGDGGQSDFVAALHARVPAGDRARLEQLDALEAREGGLSEEQELEQLRLLWPAYHPVAALAPPMPPLRISPRSAEMVAALGAAMPSLEAGLASCPVPTVFVHGERSPMPLRASRDTADRMLRAEVVVVPGAGHFIWSDSPGAVRDALDLLETAVQRVEEGPA